MIATAENVAKEAKAAEDAKNTEVIENFKNAVGNAKTGTENLIATAENLAKEAKAAKDAEAVENFTKAAENTQATMRKAVNTAKVVGMIKKLDELLSKEVFTDADMKELMKLLIAINSELLNSQRELDLNTITTMLKALKAKFEAMKDSRDANYKAAMAQAIGQIISGCFQLTGGVFSAVGGGCAKSAGFETEAGRAAGQAYSAVWKGGADIANAGGTITSGITGMIAAGYQYDAKTADIDAAQQDALLEAARKTQESSMEKALQEKIQAASRAVDELLKTIANVEKQIAS